MRGRGVGHYLLATALQHVFEQGGTLVWCNARDSAVGFYSKMGLEVRGETFEIEGIGTHVLMWREIDLDGAR